MTDALKIALIQYRDARDIRSWSGTLLFSKQAVQRHLGQVVDLSPVPMRQLPFRVANKVIRTVTGKVYNHDHEPLLARYYGWYFSRLLEREKPDLIFAPSGSACLAYLETDLPSVYFTDGPWRAIRDYYPSFRNVLHRTDRAADEMERRSLVRSRVVVVSSAWAEASVTRDYGIDPRKVHNLYIGANLPDVPSRAEVLPRRLGGKIRLLMVGVLWELKGGDIAYETLLALLDAGVDAYLTVVGCAPPASLQHPRLRVIPFLNKQEASGLARFQELWREADFFILPSRAEAAGVVFCEAAANALPVLATRTGGIPSLVVDGENGFTLPLDARGREYARKVLELVEKPGEYARLCERSRESYEKRLNWDTWGRKLADVVAHALPHFEERIRNWQGAAVTTGNRIS